MMNYLRDLRQNDFFRYVMGDRNIAGVPVWTVVPEGYSSDRTFRGFMKFLCGERDPIKLYYRL